MHRSSSGHRSSRRSSSMESWASHSVRSSSAESWASRECSVGMSRGVEHHIISRRRSWPPPTRAAYYPDQPLPHYWGARSFDVPCTESAGMRALASLGLVCDENESLCRDTLRRSCRCAGGAHDCLGADGCVQRAVRRLLGLADGKRLVELDILIDGKPLRTRHTSGHGGKENERWTYALIPPDHENSEFAVRVKNNSNQLLSIELAIDGSVSAGARNLPVKPYREKVTHGTSRYSSCYRYKFEKARFVNVHGVAIAEGAEKEEDESATSDMDRSEEEGDAQDDESEEARLDALLRGVGPGQGDTAGGGSAPVTPVQSPALRAPDAAAAFRSNLSTLREGCTPFAGSDASIVYGAGAQRAMDELKVGIANERAVTESVDHALHTAPWLSATGSNVAATKKSEAQAAFVAFTNALPGACITARCFAAEWRPAARRVSHFYDRSSHRGASRHRDEAPPPHLTGLTATRATSTIAICAGYGRLDLPSSSFGGRGGKLSRTAGLAQKPLDDGGKTTLVYRRARDVPPPTV